jgi:hypothetical protein
MMPPIGRISITSSTTVAIPTAMKKEMTTHRHG